MKLLFVNGCISQRGEESRTLVLARSFLDAWQARHPEAEVETVEPEALLALKPFAPEMLNDRDALAGVRCFDAPVYDLARQFRAAEAKCKKGSQIVLSNHALFSIAESRKRNRSKADGQVDFYHSSVDNSPDQNR